MAKCNEPLDAYCDKSICWLRSHRQFGQCITWYSCQKPCDPFQQLLKTTYDIAINES
jgi:hypothetical protein